MITRSATLKDTPERYGAKGVAGAGVGPRAQSERGWGPASSKES
jgi:hypothetical protein